MIYLSILILQGHSHCYISLINWLLIVTWSLNMRSDKSRWFIYETIIPILYHGSNCKFILIFHETIQHIKSWKHSYLVFLEHGISINECLLEGDPLTTEIVEHLWHILRDLYLILLHNGKLVIQGLELCFNVGLVIVELFPKWQAIA